MSKYYQRYIYKDLWLLTSGQDSHHSLVILLEERVWRTLWHLEKWRVLETEVDREKTLDRFDRITRKMGNSWTYQWCRKHGCRKHDHLSCPTWHMIMSIQYERSESLSSLLRLSYKRCFFLSRHGRKRGSTRSSRSHRQGPLITNTTLNVLRVMGMCLLCLIV